MKVVIIGAGAMGCLYGSYLARGRQDVWMFDPRVEHVTKINTTGLSIVSSTDKFTVKVRATSIANEIGAADLVIVCLKSNCTAQAATLAELFMKPGTIVLSVQNGLGNAEQLVEALGAERVMMAATLMGAILLETGMVVHSGMQKMHIAAWEKDNEQQLNRIAEVFTRAGFPVVIESNMASLLWSKLSLHAGLNAITAITRANNQKFLELPEANRLARMAVAEVVAVATAAGIPLLYPNCAQEMLNYAEAMKEYESPMLQDIMHKRWTEVDAINGAVVQEGRKLGIPTPVNETLTLIIKMMEALYKA